MLFINTRPQDRASQLTHALIESNYQVEELPLLELIAAPFSLELQQLYKQLHQVQIIVVVSPTAVEIGMRYLKQAGLELDKLQYIQWIAVGKTTARTLAKFGIKCHVPELETSEGMLALPQLVQPNKITSVAFWRGLGGRQFMMQQLQQQGLNILNFVLYQRQCPEPSQLKFPILAQKYQKQPAIAILISSEASWRYWQQLLQQYPIQTEWVYLVLGARLTQLLKNAQLQFSGTMHILKLESLSSTEIITRLGRWQNI